MYENIIFDIGNVLLNFKPEEYMRSRIEDEEKIPRIYREIFLGEEWIMLDRGTITEEEAIERIKDRVGNDGPLVEMAFDNWYEILTPIVGTVDILKRLKYSGYKIYYLSNFHMLAFEYIIKKYDFFSFFDGGIVSYKVKLLKPEEGIFRTLMDEYDLNPSESLLIDDTMVNINGAAKLGFGTITFKDAEDLNQALMEYGIL